MSTVMLASAKAQVAGAVPATYFGLSTLHYATDVPGISYGLTRSWDADGLDWADSNTFPGVYNFTALDKFITFSGSNSSQIIYTFGRTPRWASSQPNSILSPYGTGQCAPPSNLANWDNYVRAVAIHAAGRIKYWELWDQPQSTQYYCGSMSTMVLMAQHAYTIIKSIDSSAVILSPSVTGTTGPTWLNAFLKAGGGRYVDAIAFQGMPGQTAETITTIVPAYKTVMQQNNVAAKLLFDTQTSWSTGVTPTLTAAQEAGFVAKYYLLDWSLGVSSASWYGYDAATTLGQLWASATGLSAAGTAYTQVYNWMVGNTMSTACSKDGNNIWACTFTGANGYQAQATWITNSSMSVTVPSNYTQYRDLTGATYNITNNTVTIGDQPILLEGNTNSSGSGTSTPPTNTLASHLNGGLTNGGFVGSYYTNANWNGTPSFQRNDVRIDMAWNGMKPGGSNSGNYAAVPATGFSASWTGNLLPAVSGTYTFTGQSAGLMQLLIAPSGQTPSSVFTINNSQLTTGTGAVTLTAGVNYQVVINYSASATSPAAHLSWGIQGQAQQILEPAIPLGVNMNSAYDFDTAMLFADTIKQSRGFTAALDASSNSSGVPVPLDSQGWPTTDFLVVPFAGLLESNGTYLLQFNGKAQVLMGSAASYTATAGGNTYSSAVWDNYVPAGVGYNSATNTTTILITGNYASTQSPNFLLNFAQTQRTATSATNTGLTNIKFMRPTAPGATTYYPATSIFNNGLKQDVANFTTLRAMDYLQTNGNVIQHWSDRPTGSQPIAAPSWVTNAPVIGSPLEYLVMFANETGKDVWINVPVSADDTYVTNLALLLKYGSDGVNPYTSVQANPVFPPLQPHLKAYIEYSNEVWNSSFAQFGTNLALTNAEVAAGNSPLNYNEAENTSVGQYQWASRRVAERTMQISNDFRAVWGDAAMINTIRPVMEWQAGCGNYSSCYYELDLLDSYYNNADGIQHVSNPHPVSYYIWGGGGQWYNGVNNPSASTIDAMYASGQALPTSVGLEAGWTISYGISDAGYEGSFNVGGDGPSALQLSANLDPRAQTDTAAGINYFFANGGGLGLIYTIAGSSTYGLADPTVYENTTPKMEAVNQIVSGGMPALVEGALISGTTQLSSTTADIAIGGFSVAATGYPSYDALTDTSCWIGWTLNVISPGTYTLSTVIGEVYNAPPYYTTVTHANGLADTATYTVYLDGAPISGSNFTLPAGLHSIKIRPVTSSGVGISSITLTKLSANPYP